MPYAALFLALTLAACSLAGSDGERANASSAEGVLVNQTAGPLFAFAVDAETATRIDINPRFEITDDTRGGVVPPGASAPLEVEAYDPGDGVVVFVYRVADGVAEYAATVSVDGPTFEREEGVVTVERL